MPEEVVDRIITKQISKSSWKDWFSRTKKKDSVLPAKKGGKSIISPSSGPLSPPSEMPSQFDLDKNTSPIEPDPFVPSKSSEPEIIIEKAHHKPRKHANSVDNSDAESVTSDGSTVKVKKVKRTLRPTSAMLKSLKLKQGKNEVMYTVNGESISGFIYCWEPNANIVISDVDGTITR